MELKKTPVNEPGTPPPHQPGHPEQPEQPTDAGQHLNRIITTKEKRPVCTTWKPYQTRQITPAELAELRAHPKAYGEAIICGAISGGLEVIDVDTKNDPGVTLHTDFLGLIEAAEPELFARLPIVLTVNGGAHIYYRCAKPEPNQPFAQRNPTADEAARKAAARVVLIETRGEGGYIIAPPTPGYRMAQGSLNEIPFISDETRANIHNLARSFNELQPEPEPVTPRSQQGNTLDTLSPFDDFNQRASTADICEILKDAGYTQPFSRGPRYFFKRPGDSTATHSGDWNEDLRLFGVFSTSCYPFEPGKGYKPATVLNLVKFGGDWKATAAHLRALGYGNTISGKQLRAVNKAQDLIRANKPEAKIIEKLKTDGLADSEEEARQIIAKAEEIAESGGGDFWSFEKGGRVTLNYTRLFQILESLGFAQIDSDSDSTKPVYIQTKGRIIQAIDPGEMARAIFSYLQQEGAPAEVEEAFRKQVSQILAPGSLQHNIVKLQIQTLRDTPETKYLPFLNGVAAMDKAGNVSLIDYTEAPAYVWQAHIIQRNFDPDPDFIFSLEQCVFFQFLKCISGEHRAPGVSNLPRTNYALRVFGYLCDTVKDSRRPWCVLLSEEIDSDEKGGGTGKGIFMQGVSQAAPVCEIDGKAIRPDDSLIFSRVEPQITRVAFLNDIPKRFNLESLYNQITDTFIIRRLYKGQTAIPFSDSPKLAVSTNFAVELEAKHAARRIRQFEFSPTFSPNYKPDEHFGHELFKDWDQHEWNRFFNLVFFAVRVYREHPEGLENVPPSEAQAVKLARIKYTPDFVEWLSTEGQRYAGKEIEKGELYKEFQTFAGYANEKDFSKKRFFEAMKATAATFGLPFIETRPGGARAYKFYERD